VARAARPRTPSSAPSSRVITGVAMIVWGLVRSLDERLLLGQESHSGSIGVQIAGLVLALAGASYSFANSELAVPLLIRQSTTRPSDSLGATLRAPGVIDVTDVIEPSRRHA